MVAVGAAASGHGRRRTRGPLVTIAAIAATSALAGCHGSGGTDSGIATPGSPESSAGPRYTADERALYRRAVRLVEHFDERNQSILAAGRATREAKEFYQRRLRDWRPTYALLRRYERDGIRIARSPVVLSTEAASVKDFQDDAAEVVLERCTDQSDLGMTQNGSPLPATYDEPVVQQVVVIRYENRTWRIASVTTTGKPCAG